jgi:hypothetical protein
MERNPNYWNISTEHVSSTLSYFSIRHRWKTGDKMASYEFEQLVTSSHCSVSAAGIMQYPMIWEDNHIYQA